MNEQIKNARTRGIRGGGGTKKQKRIKRERTKEREGTKQESKIKISEIKQKITPPPPHLVPLELQVEKKKKSSFPQRSNSLFPAKSIPGYFLHLRHWNCTISLQSVSSENNLCLVSYHHVNLSPPSGIFADSWMIVGQTQLLRRQFQGSPIWT